MPSDQFLWLDRVGQIRGQGARSRASTRPDRNSVVSGVLDKVPDDQKVWSEALAIDDLEFGF